MGKSERTLLGSLFLVSSFLCLILTCYRGYFRMISLEAKKTEFKSDELNNKPHFNSHQNNSKPGNIATPFETQVLGELYFLKNYKELSNDQFNLKFERKCGPWFDILSTWRKKLIANNNSKTLMAFQSYSGFGDRLMGIQGALANAIEMGYQLQVDWSGMQDFFEPTNFIKNKKFNYRKKPLTKSPAKKGYLDMLHTDNQFVFRLVGEEYWKGYREPKCEDQVYWRCDRFLHRNRKCDVYNRACSSEKLCRKLVHEYIPPPVEFIGCPLRAILKFNDNFLKSKELVKFLLHGQLCDKTVAELIQLLRENDRKLIAVHIRSGDTVLKLKNKAEGKSKQGIYDSSQMQANGLTILEENLLENAYACFPNDLIIFASDNERVREYVRTNEVYKKRSLILLSKPVHISDLDSFQEEKVRKQKLRETFLEWLLIYLSDELITNSGHIFGISAFSRSARLFGLSSRYYLVEGAKEQKCTLEKFKYDGNIKKVRNICKKFT